MKPEVSGKIAKERLHELNSLIEGKNYNFRKNFSGDLEVLIESEKNGLYQGLDQHFNKILIESDVDLVGNWVNVTDYEVKEGYNYAKL
jgi:tRNA A37 methylthiotransferase MiaB